LEARYLCKCRPLTLERISSGGSSKGVGILEKGYAQGPMVVLEGGAVFYARDTSVTLNSLPLNAAAAAAAAVGFPLDSSVSSRCFIRICRAMVGVSRRPLLP
jgi:hypothetical protein